MAAEFEIDDVGMCTGSVGATTFPCTCLRLRRVARQITSLYDAALARNGVSIVTYAVLSALSREEQLTLSMLAERVGTDRTTLSRTVERMRAADLVETAPGDDRRERRLSLTRHGRETAEAARRSWVATAAELEARYGAGRLGELHRLLADLERVAAAELEHAAPGELEHAAPAIEKAVG